MFESMWILVYLNYHGWWCFCRSDFILYSNQIKPQSEMTWQGLSEMLLSSSPRQHLIARPRKWRAGWSRPTTSSWRAGTPRRERATRRDTMCVSVQMLHVAFKRLALNIVISRPAGVSDLPRVLQWAATAHHASADGHETKPATERRAASPQRGVGQPHWKGRLCPTLVSSSLTFSLLVWNVIKFSVSLFSFVNTKLS